MKRKIIAMVCLIVGLGIGDAFSQSGWQRDGRNLLTNFNNMYVSVRLSAPI